MPATIFSGSDIKTLKDNLSLNDKAKILPVSGSPASGAGVAAPIGSLVLDYTNGKTYKKIGALDTDWSELGSGIGGINYVTNTDAEAGTTGWSTYADAAGAQPVDGTGGSPNVTWTRSTTTPLRGTADFNFAKDAANRQGQGVATDITINLADQAKVLTVSFDYEILSGTYATGDLTVYLIQDPAGTPVVIQPAGYQVQSATAGTKMRQIATFQTASTGQSYRICFHVASTSASAYTLAIDNVICGPQIVQYGAPVTDWQDYTPALLGFGTVSGLSAKWRRVGDSVEILGRFTSGTTTAVAAGLGLPSGLSVDTTKLITDKAATLGFLTRATSGAATTYPATNIGPYVVFHSAAVGSQYLAVSQQVQLVSGGQYIAANGSAVCNTGDSASFEFRVPILGWSSTVQMSNDTDTRVVAASATNGNGASVTANNPIIFTANNNDTHGAYNSSTGRYTVPVAGFYQIEAVVSCSAATSGGAIYLYKNGVQQQLIGSFNSNLNAVSSGIIYCQAQDVLDVRPANACTLSATAANCALALYRLSGPSAIAASESVIVSCIDTSGVTIGITDTDAGRTLIQYAVEEIDTHGAFSSGIFTAPISGKYEVSAAYMSGGTTISNMAIHIYKNGASLIRHITYSGGASINHMPRVSKVLTLNAGDTVEIRGRASTATTLDTSTNPTGNMLSIRRVGN